MNGTSFTWVKGKNEQSKQRTHPFFHQQITKLLFIYPWGRLRIGLQQTGWFYWYLLFLPTFARDRHWGLSCRILKHLTQLSWNATYLSKAGATLETPTAQMVSVTWSKIIIIIHALWGVLQQAGCWAVLWEAYCSVWWINIITFKY